ncbi:putative dolichol-phosphate mannosyltransferase; putative membrane protein [Hyphomicrobium sp. GJ21]|uniref:glycosyltransferase n=1 Tax=Hyphomicrobium sp. GJ21 TaxID=113574 RepID=UPI000622BDD5|nr:glycosyltransferase family 2 protein [Hyphomicrobium sp. GJ21]CEJ84096.1 putative dolichol-phosphate mannosyltransferase; putative membrane protein [Hyphomicrobium sp. GJ21]
MNAIIAAQPRDFLYGRAAALARPRVSIIVPTYREAENVAPTVAAIERALGDIAWEIIFVDDDSPDGTVAAVRSLGERDGRVRVIRRVGRRGLAGAVIEGMMASAADIVAVIDADLQHDEALLPKMLGAIETGNADLVIATRYAQSGDAQGGFSALRRNASTLATHVSNLLLKTNVSDPMSGFFMIRRDAIDGIAPNLATGGFKLLLDILASAPDSLKIVEMPYQFRPRQLGTSKLDALVIADFLGLLLSKLSGNTISPRFFLFALVGATGLVVHLATLRTVLTTTHIPFNAAQFTAALVAMTSNFFLNNALTFRDRRLTGAAAFKGLLTFYLVCSIGTLANVGVAELIYLRDASWWRAGIAGAVMAAVFNYAVSSMLTWRK